MIADNYKLLGLVLNTIPFEYVDGVVQANYQAVVSLTELEELKSSIQQQIDSATSASDAEKLQLSDDLMFVTAMIENLTRASN